MNTDMAHDDRGLTQTLTLNRWLALPAHERVVDQLADLLFAADDLLGTLRTEDGRALSWVEPRIQCVYDTVDDVMKKLCD